ncbi:hypothetical protein Micbo1qcDRAFT_158552 [Microdochium bolleyi]|uniref:Fucose-specific lectin n=1 Tax=Microdochium bolleyi TaxID=196109 RepID=A0A136J951_9PEZI|nr:hypothetical protein Micbo1qcDRAFT_158552 [Microdochium bolleyi]
MLSRRLALGLLAATTASAGRLAAWWTNDYGPALLMQDDASGGLRYSLCNSRGTPIFPNDTSIVAPLLSFPPKKGTALAAGGWYDTRSIFASIFYFSERDEVVNSMLKCDQKTGRWTNTGDWVISEGAPTPANNSDLNVALLGEKDGYRVLYNGQDGAVHVLAYNNNGAWRYSNVAYNDSSSANVIASVYPPADLNITLLVPRDDKNLGLARFYGDNTWRIESFPRPLKQLSNQTITNNTNPANLQLNATFIPNYSLPAWDGKPKSMVMAEDSKWTRSVFYVGNDSQLYQVGNLNYKWLLFDRQDSTAWPRSDNGFLAIANDFKSDSLRLFYMSDGKLIQANGDKGNWKAAQALPSFNATADTSNNSTANPNTGNSELSSGAKAGIGVGVTLGVLAIVGIIVAVLLLKRRQKKKQEAEAAAAATAAQHGNELGGEMKSPATTYTATTYTPTELHSDHTGTTASYSNYQQGYNPNQVYHELPAQPRHAEMMGEGHYKEAP